MRRSNKLKRAHFLTYETNFPRGRVHRIGRFYSGDALDIANKDANRIRGVMLAYSVDSVIRVCHCFALLGHEAEKPIRMTITPHLGGGVR